jgi:hypothetical protein
MLVSIVLPHVLSVQNTKCALCSTSLISCKCAPPLSAAILLSASAASCTHCACVVQCYCDMQCCVNRMHIE